MSELNVSFMPELRRPVLVAAFRGWNDGGQGATLGAGYLAKQWEAEQFAEIEPETFYDFQATRPQVTLEDGTTRKLEWPENSFFHCQIPGARRHVRLAARRRSAHEAVAGDRGRHRSGVDGGARTRAIPLRRPDRHRRC